jgi:hypothetical protein
MKRRCKENIMESQRFDRIASTFAQSNSRRGVMTLLGATALGAGGLAFFAADEGEARRKKKKKKGKGKGGNRCFKSGKSCNTDKQCCGNDDLICDVPQNASNSDTACCGAQGAVCGGVNEDGDFLEPFCCIGEAGVRAFVCSENDPNTPGVRGTCIPDQA